MAKVHLAISFLFLAIALGLGVVLLAGGAGFGELGTVYPFLFIAMLSAIRAGQIFQSLRIVELLVAHGWKP